MKQTDTGCALLLMGLAMVLCGVTAAAAKATPRVSTARNAKAMAHTDSSAVTDFSAVTDQVQSWISRGYYPGASLLIVQGRKVVYERHFGDFTPGRVVYIASAGKWLGAATVAAVVDEGKLSWDDPVARWLPEFTDMRGKATLRQLLSHTSGFPPYQPDDNPPDDYQTLSESVAHCVPLKPTGAPGALFDYGGLAMQVAGRMAELATGKDWETLFEEKIARPLQMTGTHFTPVEPEHIPMIAGGVRSTLRDYGNFLEMISCGGMFHGRRVLSPQAVREMQADQVRGARVRSGAEYVEKARGETYNGIYGLGEWRERLDAQGNAALISSPGWAGAYPWIDKTHHVYGFFLAHVKQDAPPVVADHFNAFYAGTLLPILVGQVIENAPAHIKSGFADIGGGAHLYYEEAGTGPAVILLHAHSLDRRMWNPQFLELAKHYHVIRYDLRGYGFSSMPREGQQFLHADDLFALMHALHLRKAHLVGLSLGALVATDFLALHPDAVSSLTVAAGALHDAPEAAVETDSARAAQAEKDKQAKQAAIDKVQAQGLDAYKHEWLEALLSGCGPHRDEIRPQVWAMIQSWSAWQATHVEAHLLLDTPVAPRLAALKLHVPVLVLIGRKDWEGSQRSSEALLRVLPEAHGLYLENAGHLSSMETPEAFNHALEIFLASQPRGDSPL
jgi:CubicO group peptidase (beta-lactamase class C family)/pimeloyl-ACP methyl ester carboxylesterase